MAVDLNSTTTAAPAAVELSGLTSMNIAAAVSCFYVALVIYWLHQMSYKYTTPVPRLFIVTVLTGVFFLVLAFVQFSKEYLL